CEQPSVDLDRIIALGGDVLDPLPIGFDLTAADSSAAVMLQLVARSLFAMDETPLQIEDPLGLIGLVRALHFDEVKLALHIQGSKSPDLIAGRRICRAQHSLANRVRCPIADRLDRGADLSGRRIERDSLAARKPYCAQCVAALFALGL